MPVGQDEEKLQVMLKALHQLETCSLIVLA